jgi:hypothetical protein
MSIKIKFSFDELRRRAANFDSDKIVAMKRA